MARNYGATATDSAVLPDVGFHPICTRAGWFAALLCLLVVSEGYDFGVLNGAIVIIQQDLGISTFQISCLVAITPLGFIPGAASGGWLADVLGRWRALLFSCLVLTIGPLGTALAPSIGMMIAFRGLVGFGIGAAIIVVSMYLAEVAPSHARGRLTVLEEIAMGVGMALGYIANWVLRDVAYNWRWMLALGSFLPMLVAALLFLPQVPESPRWLYAVGRHEEAEDTLRAFAGEAEAKQAITLMAQQHDVTSQLPADRSPMDELQARPGLMRMMKAGCAVAVSQLGVGYLGIAYYSSTLLKGELGAQEAFKATIAMGIAKIVGSLMCFGLLEHVGRKPTLLASAVCCTLASAWLSWCFTAHASAGAFILGFCVFLGGHSFGLGSTTLVYLAEVFTLEWRGKGFAFCLGCGRIVGVLNAFSFLLIIDAIGTPHTFVLLAVVCAVCTSALWLYAYETGGMSLEDLSSLADEPCEQFQKRGKQGLPA